MPWIKLNDNAPQHPKVAALSDRAFRVWIQSLCYCAQFQTDGLLPSAFLASVTRRVYDELVDGELWITDGVAVTIHDYLKHQTSKAKITAYRERNALRQAVHRGRVTHNNRDQKIEVQNAQALPPISPSDEGDSNRVIRRHLKQAEKILQSWMGYCKHFPECGTQVECLKVIARDLAQKEKAS